MILDFEVMRRDVKREGNVDRGDEGGSNCMIHAVGHLWSWVICGQSLPTVSARKFTVSAHTFTLSNSCQFFGNCTKPTFVFHVSKPTFVF